MALHAPNLVTRPQIVLLWEEVCCMHDLLLRPPSLRFRWWFWCYGFHREESSLRDQLMAPQGESSLSGHEYSSLSMHFVPGIESVVGCKLILQVR